MSSHSFRGCRLGSKCSYMFLFSGFFHSCFSFLDVLSSCYHSCSPGSQVPLVFNFDAYSGQPALSGQ